MDKQIYVRDMVETAEGGLVITLDMSKEIMHMLLEKGFNALIQEELDKQDFELTAEG